MKNYSVIGTNGASRTTISEHATYAAASRAAKNAVSNDGWAYHIEDQSGNRVIAASEICAPTAANQAAIAKLVASGELLAD